MKTTCHTVRALFGVSCALLALACAKAETRSLVPIDVKAPADAALATITATVSQDGGRLASRTLDWTAGRGGTLAIGVYLPASASGAVDVTAEGTDEAGLHFTSGSPVRTTVQSGQLASLVTLSLKAEAEGPADGGAKRDSGAPADAKAEDPHDAMAPADTATTDTAPAATDGPPPTGRRWSPLTNVEKDPVSESYDPAVAIHPKDGHVLVAWREAAALKLLRADGATGTWGAVKTLDARGTPGYYTGTRVLFAANGDAMVLWTQDANAAALRGVWWSRSTDAGLTWTMPARVHDGPARYNLDAGISQTGQVRAVWEEAQFLNDDNVVWSAAFDPTTGAWTTAAAVAPATNVANGEHYARLAMNASGSGVLAFIDGVDSTARLSAASFTGAGPLGPVKIVTSSVGSSFNLKTPAVAVAPSGNRAVVLVVEDLTAGRSLWMHELENGTWKTAVRVPGDRIYKPSVVIDSAGVTTAAWMQLLLNDHATAFAARHTPGNGWSTAVPLETNNLAERDDGPTPRLGVDAADNVHATWTRKALADGTYPAIVRTWSGGDWQPEFVLGTKTKLTFGTPEIAVAPNGAAAIVSGLVDLQQTGDTDAFNIFAALYR
jgi:hypothetical protein